jgi:hypothetical protein
MLDLSFTPDFRDCVKTWAFITAKRLRPPAQRCRAFCGYVGKESGDMTRNDPTNRFNGLPVRSRCEGEDIGNERELHSKPRRNR